MYKHIHLSNWFSVARSFGNLYSLYEESIRISSMEPGCINLWKSLKKPVVNLIVPTCVFACRLHGVVTLVDVYD